MGKEFEYKGGPRDKEIGVAEESDFPEIHPGGEYRPSGFTNSKFGASDPDGPIPEADRAMAVWYPKETDTE
jgi:hypothetical protein